MLPVLIIERRIEIAKETMPEFSGMSQPGLEMSQELVQRYAMVTREGK